MATKCSYYSPWAFLRLQGHIGDENSRGREFLLNSVAEVLEMKR